MERTEADLYQWKQMKTKDLKILILTSKLMRTTKKTRKKEFYSKYKSTHACSKLKRTWGNRQNSSRKSLLSDWLVSTGWCLRLRAVSMSAICQTNRHSTWTGPMDCVVSTTFIKTTHTRTLKNKAMWTRSHSNQFSSSFIIYLLLQETQFSQLSCVGPLQAINHMACKCPKACPQY